LIVTQIKLGEKRTTPEKVAEFSRKMAEFSRKMAEFRKEKGREYTG